MKYALFFVFAWFLWACSSNRSVNPCVKAEYLGNSGTPCGGADLIRVLEGSEQIYVIMPDLQKNPDLIITTTLPADFRQPGKTFYFHPQKLEPRVCLHLWLSFPEVNAINVSGISCEGN